MVELNKKELILKNIYLIKHFASKFYIDDFNINYESLINTGMNGLLEAIEDFNPHAGLKFSSVATNIVKFKILDEIKRASSFTKEDVLQVQSYTTEYLNAFRSYNATDDNNEITNLINIDNRFKNKCLIIYTAYLDDFLSDLTIVNTNESLNILDSGIKQLSNLEKKVLYLYYTEEFNYSQIKFLLDVPEENLFFIHTIALAKLREIILNTIHN